MKVTYFGNMTSAFSGAKTTIETLAPLFGDFSQIYTSSSAKNMLVRLMEMIFIFFTRGLKSEWILIDVYSTKAYLYAEVIAKLSVIFHKKYIIILHGGNLPERHRINPNSIYRVFDRADLIVAPSPYLKNYFEKCGYLVTLIPNPIELENYPFFQRTNLRPKVLGIRGFKSPYNAIMTLDAIRICRDRGKEIDLLLLGNKEEDDYCKIEYFINKNKLEDLVTISKKIPKKEWIELSRDYDIMVSNPFIDNSPVSIIEGLALGMCVITTNVGGIPDFVSNNEEVLYVKSDDSEDLANKILDLIGNPSVASKLSSGGRRRAEEFDWGKLKLLWKSVLGV
ncbi:glycosyltransferase family 4 protein [Sphingobacterium multivorum]|uniref:glycosyltransferase family 4 protein n=1 Tax=Sphingobacterium multivorum TaxID=28454 RepID=UPI0028B00C8C|nr:glycosyltransferase family 4 protein [Sphingobacterium multivorum]